MTELDESPASADPPAGSSQLGPNNRAFAKAEAAFERGDYGAVRALLMPLRSSQDADERARAEHLLERTTPAPLAKYLLALTLALLAFVTWFAYWAKS